MLACDGGSQQGQVMGWAGVEDGKRLVRSLQSQISWFMSWVWSISRVNRTPSGEFPLLNIGVRFVEMRIGYESSRRKLSFVATLFVSPGSFTHAHPNASGDNMENPVEKPHGQCCTTGAASTAGTTRRWFEMRGGHGEAATTRWCRPRWRVTH